MKQWKEEKVNTPKSDIFGLSTVSCSGIKQINKSRHVMVPIHLLEIPKAGSGSTVINS